MRGGAADEGITTLALQTQVELYDIEGVGLHGAILEGLARTGHEAVARMHDGGAVYRGVVHGVACHVGGLELFAAGAQLLGLVVVACL